MNAPFRACVGDGLIKWIAPRGASASFEGADECPAGSFEMNECGKVQPRTAAVAYPGGAEPSGLGWPTKAEAEIASMVSIAYALDDGTYAAAVSARGYPPDEVILRSGRRVDVLRSRTRPGKWRIVESRAYDPERDSKPANPGRFSSYMGEQLNAAASARKMGRVNEAICAPVNEAAIGTKAPTVTASKHWFRPDEKIIAECGDKGALWAEAYTQAHGGDAGLMTAWFSAAIEAAKDAKHRTLMPVRAAELKAAEERGKAARIETWRLLHTT